MRYGGAQMTTKCHIESRGRLRTAMTHLPTKFGAKILSKPELLTLFPKLKMAAAAILNFQVM